MNNLELLKEKASCFKCSNCKTTGNRLIAPSTAISGQYYITCMTCGNVNVAKENLGKDGQVAFTVNETSKTKKTAAVEMLMNDAKKAYEALGYPIEHMCVSPKEAEKYLLKKELKAELLQELMEENEYIEDHDKVECEAIKETFSDRYINKPHAINIDSDFKEEEEYKTYIVVANRDENEYIEARYVTKNIEELQISIEKDFTFNELNSVHIYEIAREITVSKKIVLK